jgi:hypothetical protein
LLWYPCCVLQGDNRSPSRGHSAPDLHSSQSFGALHQSFPDEPEGIMLGQGASASTLTQKGKPKSTKKSKKYSETEARLRDR